MKHGVSIARGSLFGTEEQGWFRLTFTISEEEIREGIQRLEKGLEEVQQKLLKNSASLNKGEASSS